MDLSRTDFFSPGAKLWCALRDRRMKGRRFEMNKNYNNSLVDFVCREEQFGVRLLEEEGKIFVNQEGNLRILQVSKSVVKEQWQRVLDSLREQL